MPPPDWQRDPKDEWITTLRVFDYLDGPPRLEGYDQVWINVAGYDLARAIRNWLKAEGKTDKSVCEVLLEEGWPEVSRANCFYSHLQIPSVSVTVERIIELTCRSHPELLPIEETFFWLDFLVLRQCTNDFDLQKVRAIIKQVGRTCVEILKERGGTTISLPYLKRSFCVFELFTSVELLPAKDVLINIDIRGMTDELRFEFKRTPVKTKNALTRNEEDKKNIDEFITGSIGFKRFDAIVTEAIINVQGPSRKTGKPSIDGEYEQTTVKIPRSN